MKNKIKIIDILCYISTGDYDKVPKRIRYRYGYLYKDFTFDGESLNYISDKDILFGEDITAMLNHEVEILDNIPSPDNYVPIEKQMKNDTFTGGKLYVDGKEIMSMEIDNREDEFEDIEELNLETKDKWYIGLENGKTLDIGSFINSFNTTINQLIKNQKKIISELKKEGK